MRIALVEPVTEAQALTARILAEDLLTWRADLRRGAAWKDVATEYAEFTALITAFPPHERVDRVLGEALWDRRRSELQRGS